MQVIPVIAARGGEVVHAAGGDRARYQPIRTPLAEGSDPVAIARALLALGSFSTLYVADLDGIEGRGADLHLVARLATTLAGTELWVDNGAASRAAAAPLLAFQRATIVVGSETLASAATLKEISTAARDRLVLSLDFRGETFLGPPGLLGNAALWPRRVIVMTMARVGSNTGPDLARIADIAGRGGEARRVYAAGGIRDAADLAAALEAGAAGALVATALHAGKIRAGDLREIAGSS